MSSEFNDRLISKKINASCFLLSQIMWSKIDAVVFYLKSSSNCILLNFRVKVLKKPNAAGISHGDILNQYLVALKRDLPHLTANSPLFYRGNPATATVPSYFQNQPIGEGMLMGVAREMALFLQLPNPEKYKSHSIRHTSATLAAERGATEAQLTVSFSHLHIIDFLTSSTPRPFCNIIL